ncbi:Uncharacterized membrane protein YckC, RDD family [Streptomyces sp. DvalAA-14]|uniref:RDD family protein n=1 Tax=unclassified Streptomyces TaxID=2593676 RepID=UPI00081BB0A9|nr:RDD family protein [Streptomyces sp. DvalAA-14]MYS19242.1 RDD family protein [Streptomyces sp. SID4948]SCD40119.1 Uncharacterized membrane protein YckC, RDD family [Streptomyces sp. DvalAA-14]
MSQPPGPSNPYGDPPQPHGDAQPYSEPQQSPYPPQPGPYGQPPQQPYGYPQQGFPQQQGGFPPPQPYGYGPGPGPGSRVPLPGMPPLASWGLRLGALLLDGLMFFLVPVGLAAAGYVRIVIKLSERVDDCDNQGISSDNCPLPHTSGGSVLLIVLGGVLGLASLFYVCYREGATGQTPGKRIAGIRLLKEYDGATLGFGLAFGRRLLHVLDNMACYLGWLWPLWDEKNQTFADKLTHTVVIRDQS